MCVPHSLCMQVKGWNLGETLVEGQYCSGKLSRWQFGCFLALSVTLLHAWLALS